MLAAALQWLCSFLARTAVLQFALLAHSPQPGLVIRNEPGTWYSLTASAPVVLRFGPDDYRMWAYGREVEFGSDYSTFGRSGYFTSADGISWKSTPGDGVLGSVLDPRRGTMHFDGGALGITDVKLVNGIFYAWYMGMQDATLVNATASCIIRGGVAVSHDGIHWSRCDGHNSSYGALLDVTPSVEKFIFGPHVYEFSQASSTDKSMHSSPTASLSAPVCSELPAVAGNFTMLYHSQLPNAQQLTAHSVDLLHFNKSGSLHGVSPSPVNSSFDHFAAADGRIIKTPDGYILLYEACDAHFTFSLGLARSKDGVNFVKDTSCTGIPGGPVFKPSTDPDAFDAGDVGTPFPLLQPDGELWVYYVGFGRKSASGNTSMTASKGSPPSQIGLAISQRNALGKQDYCSYERAAAHNTVLLPSSKAP